MLWRVTVLISHEQQDICAAGWLHWTYMLQEWKYWNRKRLKNVLIWTLKRRRQTKSPCM